MDKNFRKFAVVVGGVLLLFLSILIIFGFFYRYSTINTYNVILLILMALTTIIIIFYLTCAAAIFYVYKTKRSNRILLFICASGLRAILPLVFFLCDIFKYNKDAIRKFYIEFNNLIITIGNKKYRPEDVLILLPHCLQNSECVYKITNDIENCKKCGRCTIGEVVKLSKLRGVNAEVVTGGTVARSIVVRLRPKLIVAVACERDLTSGIIDVGIPVIGLINERPHGPCYNTRVNIEDLKYTLDIILKY